jgi:chemosensory pili system protein ChpA (sensor histidine kinase/response regulator)
VLADSVRGILDRRFPEDMPQVADWLAELQAPAMHAITPVAAESVPVIPGDGDAARGKAQGLEPTTAAPVKAPQAVDELDEQLLPVFLEEAAELMPRIGEALRAWRADPAGTQSRDALKRALHTLKGSSRMAGAMVLGEAVHALETRII